jgi:hypothetical protein
MKACRDCDGVGKVVVDGVEVDCSWCHGHGGFPSSVDAGNGQGREVVPCRRCHSGGKVRKVNDDGDIRQGEPEWLLCPDCRGMGFVRRGESIDARQIGALVQERSGEPEYVCRMQVVDEHKERVEESWYFERADGQPGWLSICGDFPEKPVVGARYQYPLVRVPGSAQTQMEHFQWFLQRVGIEYVVRQDENGSYLILVPAGLREETERLPLVTLFYRRQIITFSRDGQWCG